MAAQQNPHWGTTPDEFLDGEGIRESAKAEAVTRSFNGLVQSRIARDPAFAKALLRERFKAKIRGEKRAAPRGVGKGQA